MKSIIFSGDMVRAILEGRKTQTRRLLKPQPTHQIIEGMGHVTKGMDPADDGAIWYDADCINPGREVRCPYGRVGDRLWVRETWCQLDEDTIGYKAGMFRPANSTATGTDDIRWRSPIHMPKLASRLTLEITGVRVQQLDEISPLDAKAEGMECPPDQLEKNYWGGHLVALRDAWNAMHGPKSWDANPWVWVLEFKRVEATS